MTSCKCDSLQSVKQKMKRVKENVTFEFTHRYKKCIQSHTKDEYQQKLGLKITDLITNLPSLSDMAP